MNNIPSYLNGYERAIQIDEDGQFLGKVEYRLARDARQPRAGQLPVVFVVHESTSLAEVHNGQVANRSHELLLPQMPQ